MLFKLIYSKMHLLIERAIPVPIILLLLFKLKYCTVLYRSMYGTYWHE
jgi:hypothetical protein